MTRILAVIALVVACLAAPATAAPKVKPSPGSCAVTPSTALVGSTVTISGNVGVASVGVLADINENGWENYPSTQAAPDGSFSLDWTVTNAGPATVTVSYLETSAHTRWHPVATCTFTVTT